LSASTKKSAGAPEDLGSRVAAALVALLKLLGSGVAEGSYAGDTLYTSIEPVDYPIALGCGRG